MMPRSSSSSMEAVVNNEDLLLEILVWLPLKPLVSFKCVSKQWQSLISSHHVSKTHTTRQGTLPAPSGLFLSNDRLIIPLFKYVPLSRSSKTCLDSFALPYSNKILHSCNGLLLFCSRRIPFDFEVDPFDFDAYPNSSFGVTFFVYNPTTKQSRSVFFPPNNIEFDFSRFECGSYIQAANLAFDPCHSPYFKIVCVLTNPDLEDGHHWLYVYDSQTNTWNSSPIPFDPPETTDFCTPVFYRRAIHWYSHHPTSLYFDVDKQRLHPFPMPHFLSNDDDCFVQYFGEFRGRLHLIAFTTSSIKFDVLVLDEDYSGWSIRYFVNLYTLRLYCRAQGIPNERFVISALSIVPGERGEDSQELVFFVLDVVYSYNLKNGSINRLMGFSVGLSGEDDERVNGHPFVPTLCPI